MPSSMYIMPPASATVASFGIELDLDELHVVAENLVVDLVHRCHLGSFRVDRADGDQSDCRTAKGPAYLLIRRTDK